MRKEFKLTMELIFTYPCGGYITQDGNDTGTFLQGDDYYDLESQLEALWKLVTWKKIGQRKACEMQDSILSEYIPS